MRLIDITIPFLGSDITIKELANKHDLTPSRVGQIIKRDLTKVLKELNIEHDANYYTIKKDKELFLKYISDYNKCIETKKLKHFESEARKREIQENILISNTKGLDSYRMMLLIRRAKSFREKDGLETINK